MKPVIPCILGPTASGKTFLAVELARIFPIEIISVDSRQVYRKMDIGTAKPPREILNKFTHHLIDIRDPDEQFTAGQFVELVTGIVDKILSRKRIPLFAGGTGMYILALEKGLFKADTDPEVREKLRHTLNDKGLPSLYQELIKVDPKTGKQLHPNDKQRILRALEVFYSTGKPISYWKEEKTESPFNYSLKKFILFPEREFLYQRINQRVETMLSEGLIEEVRSLLNDGYTKESPGLRSVGYQETIDYLEGKISKDELTDEIQKNTRRYAKRQYTWFRKYGEEFLHFNSTEQLHDVFLQIKSWIETTWERQSRC